MTRDVYGVYTNAISTSEARKVGLLGWRRVDGLGIFADRPIPLLPDRRSQIGIAVAKLELWA
jgi:hypothetical protein